MTAQRSIGDNRFSFPKDDKTAATKAAYTYLQRFMAERRQIATRVRDVVQDAKATGYRPAAFRVGLRLARMTPEKREKFFADTSLAVALFGMGPVQMLGDETRDNKFWGFVEQAIHLCREKDELKEMFADLAEESKAAGVDYDALRQLYSGFFALEDKDARMDKFDRIDAVGRSLGYWD